MVVLQANKWLGVLTNLVAFSQVLDTIQSGSVSKLVRSAEDIQTPYGDGKVVRSVNIPEVEDLDAENSTLLTTTKPDVREQYFPISAYKVVPLTINRYLIRGAFTDETAMAEFTAYVMGTMEKAREVYLYGEILKQYVIYNPAQATQKVSVNLTKITNTMTEVEKQFARTANANAIVKMLIRILRDMAAPTSDYNDDGLTEIINGDDLKFIINSDFDVEMIVETFATLYGPGKITEEERWNETISIPPKQLKKAGAADPSTIIGWFGHRKKVQFGYFYVVATSFFDGSTLNQNNWLHFSYYMALVNSLPCVKLTANYVEPAAAAAKTTAVK